MVPNRRNVEQIVPAVESEESSNMLEVTTETVTGNNMGAKSEVIDDISTDISHAKRWRDTASGVLYGILEDIRNIIRTGEADVPSEEGRAAGQRMDGAYEELVEAHFNYLEGLGDRPRRS